MSFNMFGSLGGIQLIESVHCVKRFEKSVARTWRERLFTFPWCPWIATKMIIHYEPDPNLYEIKPFCFVGHPATIARLHDEINRRNVSK